MASPGSRRRLRQYRMTDEDFSKARPVPQPSASCLLLRRSFLPDDHIFDERYPIFFNDVQLARSFADRGLTLWVTPDAAVVHEAHASTRMLGCRESRITSARSFECSATRNRRPRCGSIGSSSSSGTSRQWMLGHSSALGVRDLWKALSGDVGPLPSGPARSMSSKGAGRRPLEGRRTSRP